MDRMLLKENRWMDDVLFPINGHRFSCTPDDNIFTCHWHDEMECLWIREGEALLQIGTVLVPAVAGEAFLIHSGELHAGLIPPQGKGFSFSAIVFHPSMLYGSGVDTVQTRYLDPIVKGGLPPFLPMRPGSTWENRALEDIAALDDLLFRRGNAYEVGVKAHLFDLFYQVLSSSPDLGAVSPPDTEKTERIKQVLGHIRDHYADPLPVAALAALAGFSVGHFCTFFRRMTGTTFVDYLNRYRVNRAADLLRETDRKILDVAMEVGFDNASYFITKFKQYMRCTPHVWRRGQATAP